MTYDEAIASLKTALEQGDKECGRPDWKGGGFRSQAVRVILEDVERFRVAIDQHIAAANKSGNTVAFNALCDLRVTVFGDTASG